MLCQLKRQGLPLNCLNLVFDSLIMSRLMYADILLLGLVTLMLSVLVYYSIIVYYSEIIH